ncbi:MAG: ATP-binding protein [Verrucomicrobia bacterium]|nr:ATP-binding protein [Verrucomicrobiota bacterium]
MNTLANQKHITLEFDVAANLPPLFADEAKLKQILYNLLSNAIKFTPDGGQIKVTARLGNQAERPGLTPLNSEVAGDWLDVTVADSGIGVQPCDQRRIFAQFEQVDSSYGRQQQGTGLGLALTKRLVELHGGRIWVESEGIAGKGSRFTFLIPQPKPEPRPSEAGDPAARREEVRQPLIVVAAGDKV